MKASQGIAQVPACTICCFGVLIGICRSMISLNYFLFGVGAAGGHAVDSNGEVFVLSIDVPDHPRLQSC